MLDLEQSKKIWYKLTEQDYCIEKITIGVNTSYIGINTGSCIYIGSCIEIIFFKNSDLEKFRELIFDLIYVDISSYCSSADNSLILLFEFNFDFIEKIIYPVHTKEINIISRFIFDNDNKIISLGLLPSELKKLKIISSIPFDLTNLPNQLEQLDLDSCTGWKKFNLEKCC